MTRWPVVVLLIVAAPVAGCASASGAGSHHLGLTDQQFQTAVNIARSEAQRLDATVELATAKLGNGTITDSNTGHQCRSGQLLHIEVIGTFPRVAVAGAGAVDPAAPSSDSGAGAVHAELIVADPATQQPCLISVKTGHVEPDPGAATLLTH